MKTDGSKLEDYIYKIAKKYKQSSKESKIRVGKMVCCNTN